MRCLSCKENFTPKFFLQKHCMEKDECIKAFTTYAKEVKEKQSKQSWNKEKKERKEANMTHSEWLKILQAVFNTFIRERDKGKECVSCGCNVLNGHASHMFSVGSHPNLRFNEDNVNLSCIECNLHKHGNLIEYTLRLPNRIGQERFNALIERSKKTTLKLSIPEIKDKIKEYKEKIKQLNLKQ